VEGQAKRGDATRLVPEEVETSEIEKPSGQPEIGRLEPFP